MGRDWKFLDDMQANLRVNLSTIVDSYELVDSETETELEEYKRLKENISDLYTDEKYTEIKEKLGKTRTAEEDPEMEDLSKRKIKRTTGIGKNMKRKKK